MVLTDEEKTLILTSLLFTACVDLGLDNKEDDKLNIKRLNLAKKLSKEYNINDLTDTELYLFGENFEEEKMVKEIQDNFIIVNTKI